MLEPGTPLDWNWHIEAIAAHVQAALEGWIAVQRYRSNPEGAEPEQLYRNIVINVPPGTAKSRIVSVFAPAWMWLHWPGWRAICLSSNPRVAVRDSIYCRQVIESDWYRDWFRPAWGLAPDQNAKMLFKNTEGGFRQAQGFMAKITGDRADALLVDDPHDAEEVKSDVQRESALSKWDDAISNRVNDLRSSVRVLIMQRLHEADLSGHVLGQGGWEHLRLPQEYEPTPSCSCESCRQGVTRIGWRDPRCEVGELLFPVRFPRDVLAAERARLGADGYAGQHQQEPADVEGVIFKTAWFSRRYRNLAGVREVWTCWDTALKAKEANDESAFTVFALLESGDILILRAGRGHWETPELQQFLVEQARWLRKTWGERYRGDFVEDKVSGTTLMRYIKRDSPDVAVIPVPAEQDKEARARGVTPICEAGRVLLPDETIFPQSVEWSRDLLHQVTTFPKGRYKDLTDTFVYGLMRVMGTMGRRSSRRGRGGQV